jgi:diguanylate cyclase (GGDEF)-like protein
VINDTHRHQTGDKVLQVVAGRLKGCVRESDMVGRLHGDEFVVALRDLDRSRLPDILQSRIRRIQSIISEPMGVDGVSLETSAAVGAALYPDDADDAEALLDIADAAMFQNKKNNRG